jgi:hypothetical protein
MKNIVFALLAFTVLAPLAASAKPYHLTSVRWIVDTRNNIDVDDRYVTIVGHVTRRLSDEEYWFTDNTGQIRLDSENFDLPIGPRVMIGGRIDQAYLGFGHIEVDVRKWHYAPLRKPVVAVHPATHAVTPAPVVDRAPAPAPVETTNPTTTVNTTSSQTPSGPISQPPTGATPLTPPTETH